MLKVVLKFNEEALKYKQVIRNKPLNNKKNSSN